MPRPKPASFTAMKQMYESQPFDYGTRLALQEYVRGQLKDGTYDFNANKALLKLYQCQPENADVEAIAKILVLAMMNLPSTDFLVLSYLVPVRYVSSTKVQLIQRCNYLLENGKFLEFWDA